MWLDAIRGKKKKKKKKGGREREREIEINTDYKYFCHFLLCLVGKSYHASSGPGSRCFWFRSSVGIGVGLRISL